MTANPIRRGAQRLAPLHALLLGMTLASPAGAEVAAHDPTWGQRLHESHCVTCHASPHTAAFYQARQGGKIKSRDSLQTMVQACVTHFDLPWFDEEVGAVTTYLDRTHYRLD